MKKDLILFGYTGSIGKQVLEVLSSASCKYRIVGIVSYSRTDGLDKILKKFKSIEAVGIVKGELNISGKKIYMGNVLQMISDYKSACVFNAVSGVNGLEVSLEAIDLGRTLFLANKESIVIGYKLLKKSLKANPKAKIIPIDSEHSSLYKLLSLKQKVKSIYITCSGGALRDLPLEKVGSANYEMVKKHPTWSMGDKITVDCATLVNKAFEVIEARFFFDYDFDSIHVLMHDESLIHALVELGDGSFSLELASNDMKIPIAYALNDCKRSEENFSKFNLVDLHFRKFEEERYPLFRFILNNFNENTTALAIISAADEIAVNAFINDEISFKDIYTIIVNTFKSVRQNDVDSILDIMHAISEANRVASEIIEEIRKG